MNLLIEKISFIYPYMFKHFSFTDKTRYLEIAAEMLSAKKLHQHYFISRLSSRLVEIFRLFETFV